MLEIVIKKIFLVKINENNKRTKGKHVHSTYGQVKY